MSFLASGKQRCRAALLAPLMGLLAGCNAGSTPINPVMSLSEIRFIDIVAQKYDFSCGAASVATLVNGFFGEHYSELELLKMVQARYSSEEWEKKRKIGLSFDDLVYMASKIGYQAEGAVIGLSGLLQIKGPVIVHLDKGSFQHFSVFRGTKDGAILLADPIGGHTQYSPAQFVAQYTGAALAIWRKGTDLPKTYPFLVAEKDSRKQLEHAGDLSRVRREPLPTKF